MLQTRCNGCQFATLNDDNTEQIGCALDRPEKLGYTKQETKEDGVACFTLNRFCNCYRPPAWLEVISKEEGENLEDTVLREIHPRVGFIIFLDTDADNAIADLQHTVDCINNQTVSRPRYVAVVHSRVEYNTEVISVLDNTLDKNETDIHNVYNISEVERLLQIDEAFTHALNGWLYVTTSGEDIPLDLIDKIHRRVNIDMKRLVVVEPYNKLDGFMFQTALFKYFGGNKPMLESTLQSKLSPGDPEPAATIVTNEQSFLERIRSVPTNDEDTIISWEKFINEE